jgi:hypothetical protein
MNDELEMVGGGSDRYFLQGIRLTGELVKKKRHKIRSGFRVFGRESKCILINSCHMRFLDLFCH